MSGYRVDLDDLQALASRLADLVTSAESSVADVTSRVEALGQSWDGAAADAQRAAHAAWSLGARDMTAGVETMRQAALQAHCAYSAAVHANVSMFGVR